MDKSDPAFRLFCVQAFQRYTEKYKHIDMEDGMPVEYQPTSICTTTEMWEIFTTPYNEQLEWPDILAIMHEKHGTPGPARLGR